MGDHNFLISNLFSIFLNVLNAPKGGLQVLLDIKGNKTFPWLLYSNTLVASNVQLNWFMKFVMKFFYPISFGFQLYLAQYIIRSNKFVTIKHQMPLGMSEEIKIDLYEKVNFKNKIGLFYFYLYSLNLPMYNLLTNLNKPTYLIGFNNYLPT